MLKISRSMVAAMTGTQRERFATDYLSVVRHDFPELWVDQDDAQIVALLHRQCEQAQSLGIDSARGVYLLLTLRIVLARDFPAGDDDAWAREILGRDGVGEPDKLDAIEAVCWGGTA